MYCISFFSQLLVSSQSPSATTDDLYLESHTSGVLPIDDEDGEYYDSGSGSGDYGGWTTVSLTSMFTLMMQIIVVTENMQIEEYTF